MLIFLVIFMRIDKRYLSRYAVSKVDWNVTGLVLISLVISLSSSQTLLERFLLLLEVMDMCGYGRCRWVVCGDLWVE